MAEGMATSITYQAPDPSHSAYVAAAPSSSYSVGGGAATASDNDFEIIDPIGRGAFSVVVKALHHASNMCFALKRISTWNISNQPYLQQCVWWEVNVHRLLRHPNVCRMHTYYQTAEELVLVLEYCERGTLKRKLKSTREMAFDEARTVRYTRQILRGLDYLHGKGVLHRDLKLENILLDAEGRVKIADFGMSWQRAAAQYTGEDAPKFGEVPNNFGTLDYLSPEIITKQEYSERSDVWAVGVMVVEMVCGVPPFYHVEHGATMRNIVHSQPNIPYNTLSPMCLDFLGRILCKDPALRWSAAQLLQHEWIVSYTRTQPQPQSAHTFCNNVTMVMSTSAGLGISGVADGASEPPTQQAIYHY